MKARFTAQKSLDLVIFEKAEDCGEMSSGSFGKLFVKSDILAEYLNWLRLDNEKM